MCRYLLGGAVVLGVVLLFAPGAMAHDANEVVTFDNMNPLEIYHEDADPWKGFAYITVTNNSAEAWGDFHFQVFSMPPLYQDVSNVDIASTPAPLCSQSPFTYAIDNVVVGSTLDYYFYNDPIPIGGLATFTFYTDNTADKVNFGLMMWPTPVPEPATLGLLALGGVALWRRRRG